jgi:hypothetical protein
MKIYALFTLHKTGWGTRSGIGDPATATTAAENVNEKPTRPIELGGPEPSQSSRPYDVEMAQNVNNPYRA